MGVMQGLLKHLELLLKERARVDGDALGGLV